MILTLSPENLEVLESKKLLQELRFGVRQSEGQSGAHTGEISGHLKVPLVFGLCSGYLTSDHRTLI